MPRDSRYPQLLLLPLLLVLCGCQPIEPQSVPDGSNAREAQSTKPADPPREEIAEETPAEESATEEMTTATFDLSALAPRAEDPLASENDLAELPAVFDAFLHEDTWATPTSSFTLEDNQLEVQGTQKMLEQAAQLLTALEQAEAQRGLGNTAEEFTTYTWVLPHEFVDRQETYALKLYFLDGLLGEAPSPAERQELTDLIYSICSPITWDEVGGRGTLQMWRGVLLVEQSERVHAKLEQTLKLLLQARQHQLAWQNRTGPLPDPEPLPLQVLHTSPEDELIFAALDRKSDFQYTEAPLEEVAEALSLGCGIPVVLDERDLEDAGLGTDLPMSSCDLEDITLRSALRIMLNEFDLTYTVRDGRLVITTPQEVASIPQIVLYPSYDLLGDDASMAELFNVFTTIAVPTEWDEVGGIGSMDSWCGSLVIVQSPWGHDECEQLWRTLRAARQLMNDWDSITPLPTTLELVVAADQPDFALRQALKQEIDLPAQQLSLAELPQFLKDQFGCQAVFDSLYFSYDDIELDAAIALGGQGKLADVLREDLEPLDLTFEVRNEVVWITKKEPPSTWDCTIQAYPVFDLTAVPHEEGQEQTYNAARLGEWLLHLETNLSPDSWSSVGGVGELTHLGPGILVVRQTSNVHQQIEAYFEGLRAAKEEAAP